jgi:hypothetical protein
MIYTPILKIGRFLSQAPQSLSNWRNTNFAVTHAAAIGKVFSELSSDELQRLESMLKKIGRRAEGLGVCEES